MRYTDLSSKGKRAIERGELPLPAWSKKRILKALGILSDLDFSALSRDTLIDRFLFFTHFYRTSWGYVTHQPFFTIDLDYLKTVTQDDIDQFAREQKDRRR